jgi:hypothetical protein
MFDEKIDIVEQILGKTIEKDEFITQVSDEEFKKSIEETLENIERDLNELDKIKAEAMQEAMQDGFILK